MLLISLQTTKELDEMRALLRRATNTADPEKIPRWVSVLMYRLDMKLDGQSVESPPLTAVDVPYTPVPNETLDRALWHLRTVRSSSPSVLEVIKSIEESVARYEQPGR
jgi:hypothetical protein